MSESNSTQLRRIGFVSATDNDGDSQLTYRITGRYSNLFYIDTKV